MSPPHEEWGLSPVPCWRRCPSLAEFWLRTGLWAGDTPLNLMAGRRGSGTQCRQGKLENSRTSHKERPKVTSAKGMGYRFLLFESDTTYFIFIYSDNLWQARMYEGC